MTIEIPRVLRRGLGVTESGAAWIERLPELLSRAVERWDLTVGDPFETGFASWCAPARTADGRDAVLKLAFPDDEARTEAQMLRAWDGRGAVQLLDDAPADWALLLARVRPGIALSQSAGSADERLRVAAGVLRALTEDPARLAHVDVPDMGQLCRGLAQVLAERGAQAATEGELELDTGVVGVAVGLLRDLPGSASDLVVVHGDLNPGNVLDAGDGWVAIDPKALRGDPAYDLWPLLEQVDDPFATADPAQVLRERCEVLAQELDLDADRIAAWALARGVEQALWTWSELGDLSGARRQLGRAEVWAGLLP